MSSNKSKSKNTSIFETVASSFDNSVWMIIGPERERDTIVKRKRLKILHVELARVNCGAQPSLTINLLKKNRVYKHVSDRQLPELFVRGESTILRVMGKH